MAGQQQNWSQTGSFLSRPAQGWLHPDEQLSPGAGVIYGVRYIGCMIVKQSMKTLDFDTRTAVAKESINTVSESAGLKTAAKKPKKSVRVSRLLGDQTNMMFAGSNINLTITTDGLTMTVMESGEVIASHIMPSISFASGGDTDTLDFVAYVAKDESLGRACHVLECGGGLAQDVITTIGQAFELRFKQYLNRKPDAVQFPDRFENCFEKDLWGDDNDYYNDRVGAQPPSPAGLPVYDAPKLTNTGTTDVYAVVKKDLSKSQQQEQQLISLDNNNTIHNSSAEQGAVGGGAVGETTTGDGTPLDAFDMKPFSVSLMGERSEMTSTNGVVEDHTPYHEMWFHGKISRQECEGLLQHDGDFLVRESVNCTGQFVLSGRHSNRIRHLLLVDPSGMVRTKDRTFQSVSHLITHHMENQFPIVSNDSEVVLQTPILRP